MKKRVLVTGSSGFVGRHLVPVLRARGYEVIGIDRAGESQLLFNEKCNQFRASDIADLDDRILGLSVQSVIHLAATASVGESVKDPVGTHENNLTKSLELIAKCAKFKIERFVFASSCAAAEPVSPYGAQKLGVENYLMFYSRTKQLSATALRFFNIYGEGQEGEYAGVVTKFLEQHKLGKSLTIYGDGHQTRCYVYVGDVVEAIIKALESDANGVFNVADPEVYTVNQIAKAIAGVDGELEYAELPEGEIAQVDIPEIISTASNIDWVAQTDLLDWIKEQVNG